MPTIASVEPVPVALPLVTPISSSLGTYTSVPGVVVTVHTVDGLDGFGFALGLGGAWGPAASAYIADELAPLAVGRDASDPDSVWRRMWAPNKPRLRGGIGAWALSAIDIALWDIAAKASDVPLHRMVGGVDAPVPVYGSGGWLSLDDRELVAECERFVDQGIGAYKLKLGSDRDPDRIDLLRRAMGDDVTLLADANQRYSVDEAVEVSAMLADRGVAWLEEPVLADSLSDLESVARRSKVPVAAGENVYYGWGFADICERSAATFLQPDVGRCGGVGHFMQVARLAETRDLRLTSHLWHELSISLVGASPAGWAVEYAPLVPDDVWTRPFEVVDGAIDVPDVSGHGVEPAAGVIDRYRV